MAADSSLTSASGTRTQHAINNLFRRVGFEQQEQHIDGWSWASLSHSAPRPLIDGSWAGLSHPPEPNHLRRPLEEWGTACPWAGPSQSAPRDAHREPTLAALHARAIDAEREREAAHDALQHVVHLAARKVGALQETVAFLTNLTRNPNSFSKP